ncbi:MAG: hypothetical protein ACFFD3_12865 [Candidatus Thorarchaeota archaeon]
MVESDQREASNHSNPMLLKLRYAALDKAFSEIRNKRFRLDESKTHGWISEEEYQQGLVQLILEGNEIKNQQRIIEEQLTF